MQLMKYKFLYNDLNNYKYAYPLQLSPLHDIQDKTNYTPEITIDVLDDKTLINEKKQEINSRVNNELLNREGDNKDFPYYNKAYPSDELTHSNLHKPFLQPDLLLDNPFIENDVTKNKLYEHFNDNFIDMNDNHIQKWFIIILIILIIIFFLIKKR